MAAWQGTLPSCAANEVGQTHQDIRGFGLVWLCWGLRLDLPQARRPEIELKVFPLVKKHEALREVGQTAEAMTLLSKFGSFLQTGALSAQEGCEPKSLFLF